MATGDKSLATRVRGESNERLDLVDFLRIAVTPQDFAEAMTRALLSSPKATAGVAVGERWTGSITANPTSGSDGLLRVDTPVFVGVDANGGLVLKANGTALSVSIPSGGSSQQVYIYMQDVPEDTEVRRKLPATTPFNEFSAAINVAFRQQPNVYVRAGTLGSVIPSDSIAGVTRALLFLGIASNTAGAVAFTPATNMLETVVPPSTVPATNAGTTTGQTTVTGGQATLRELLNAALYGLGQTMWKGSDFVTPAAGNNYGAYQIPAGGVDKAFRQAIGYVTIGNGTTIVGDFNSTSYANSNALLAAAITSLPAQGGTIFIKRGVQLTGFNSAIVSMPASKTVEIVGEHYDMPTNVPQLTFASGEGLAASASGRLVLRNLHIRCNGTCITWTSNLKVRDVFFEDIATTDLGSAIAITSGATGVDKLDIEGCVMSTVQAAAVALGSLVRVPVTATFSNSRIVRVRHDNTGHETSLISVLDMRHNVEIGYITINWNAPVYAFFAAGQGAIILDSSDNTTFIGGRYVHDISATNGIMTTSLIELRNVGHLVIERLEHTNVKYGLFSPSANTPGPVWINDSHFVCQDALARGLLMTGLSSLRFTKCSFTGIPGNLGDGSTAIGSITFEACRFTKPNLNIQCTTCDAIEFLDNKFLGLNVTSSPNVSCAIIGSTTYLKRLTVRGNVIDNFQNISYSGADATTNPEMFKVRCTFAGQLICENNVVSNVMNKNAGSTGNAKRAPYLFGVGNFTAATYTCSIQRVVFAGNDVGSYTDPSFVALTSDAVMPMRLNDWAFIEEMRIENNRSWSAYNNLNGTNDAFMSHPYDLSTQQGTSIVCRMFTFSHNNVGITPGATLSLMPITDMDLVYMLANTVSNLCHLAHFQNNQFYADKTNAIFNSPSFGVGLYNWNFLALHINHCQAARQSTTSSTQWFSFYISGTVTHFNFTTGTIPGSAATFGDCINVYKMP